MNGPARAQTVEWSGEPAVRLEAGGYELLIVPRIGGAPVALKDRRRGLDILHAPAGPEALAKRPRIYGIPVILPPNRIRDGVFTAAGRRYELPINSPDRNHCHGLIGSLPWEVDGLRAGDGQAEATLSHRCAPDSEFHRCFPHEFTISATFRLSARGLEQEVRVRNPGPGPMPLGIGFHTAFRVPFNPASPAGAVRMRVSVGRRWEIDGRSLPTGRLLPLAHVEGNYREGGLPPQGFPIRDHYAAEPIRLDGAPFHGVVFEDRAARQQVIYEVGGRFGHWMIWNETGDGGFVCPEPMSWAIDAPNLALPQEQTGFRLLAAGEEWAERMRIYAREVV